MLTLATENQIVPFSSIAFISQAENDGTEVHLINGKILSSPLSFSKLKKIIKNESNTIKPNWMVDLSDFKTELSG
jgi:hypothetical protein